MRFRVGVVLSDCLVIIAHTHSDCLVIIANRQYVISIAHTVMIAHTQYVIIIAHCHHSTHCHDSTHRLCAAEAAVAPSCVVLLPPQVWCSTPTIETLRQS